ncbi:MAG: sulfurtransferase TusA family protein [Kiloniellales bacterium]|nr:sulfurtransferase TusA family protein [Kiloniellales bacterium]MDJ0971462.1 sulfurtransferase TusA family protein [Kiloniellales bacterium]
MSDAFLDAKGLKCPIPVLRARRAMKPLAPGDVLAVEATDPTSVQDFRAFCETTGNELLESREDDGVYYFRIRKAG